MVSVSFVFKLFIGFVIIYWIILIIWASKFKLRMEKWENEKKQAQIHVIIEEIYED